VTQIVFYWYLRRRRLSILCVTSFNKEESCRRKIQFGAILIVLIATLVRGSLTIPIFCLLSYTTKTAPNRIFLRQDCLLSSSLSICHRQFRRTVLRYPRLAPCCLAFLSALLALNWNLCTVRNPLLSFQIPRWLRSDSLHGPILR
jgi:hypothetical protein